MVKKFCTRTQMKSLKSPLLWNRLKPLNSFARQHINVSGSGGGGTVCLQKVPGNASYEKAMHALKSFLQLNFSFSSIVQQALCTVPLSISCWDLTPPGSDLWGLGLSTDCPQEAVGF